MHRTQNPTGTAADTDNGPVVTPADVLRGAARYLEIHGWTQGSYYNTRPGDALRLDDQPFPAACAIGAIGMAAHGRLITIPTEWGSGVGDCRRAIDYLSSYLIDTGAIAAQPDDWDTTPANAFDWNDRDDQTAEDVIAALRAAADNYDWLHATEEQLETYADACVWNETNPTREGFLAWLGGAR